MQRKRLKKPDRAKRQRRNHTPGDKLAALKDRLTVTPRESVRLTRLGINYTYNLINSGQMPAIEIVGKTGKKRYLIPKSVLLRWLEEATKTPLNAA
jgi:hypothetical protein